MNFFCLKVPDYSFLTQQVHGIGPGNAPLNSNESAFDMAFAMESVGFGQTFL